MFNINVMCSVQVDLIFRKEDPHMWYHRQKGVPTYVVLIFRKQYPPMWYLYWILMNWFIFVDMQYMMNNLHSGTGIPS